MKITSIVLPLLAGAVIASAGQFTFSSDVCQDSTCSTTAPAFSGAPGANTILFGSFSPEDQAGTVGDGGGDSYDTFGWVSNRGNLSLNQQTDSLSNNTYRWVLTFTNNTISAISQSVTFLGDLGSDSGTTLLSSGAFYRVTGDNPVPASLGDPVVSLVFGNNGVASGFTFVHGTGFNSSTNDLEREGYQFTVNLNPGQSASYAFFSFVARDDIDRTGDPALADSTAQSLVSNPDFSGLSNGQISSIVNFNAGAATTAPEPATLALVGAALLGLGLARRKRR